MKCMKRILPIVFVLALMLNVGICAHAETPTYTVRIYAGSQGTINGEDAVEYQVGYGDRVSFSLGQVALNDGSKYYVRGIREAGMDNDTVNNASFQVTRDIDYVVVYGILSSSVSYTVNYVDENGNTLAPSETFYGNAGDKPVVAYTHIDGYAPKYYNLTGTLSEDSSQNVFSFEYTPVSRSTGTNTDQNNNNQSNDQNAGQNQNPTGTQDANRNPAPNENPAVDQTTAPNQNVNESAGQNGDDSPAANAPAANTPAEGDQGEEGPEEILDLDVPRAENAGGAEAEPESQTAEESGSRSVLGTVAAVVAIAAALGGLGFALALRKKKKAVR